MPREGSGWPSQAMLHQPSPEGMKEEGREERGETIRGGRGSLQPASWPLFFQL